MSHHHSQYFLNTITLPYKPTKMVPGGGKYPTTPPWKLGPKPQNHPFRQIFYISIIASLEPKLLVFQSSTQQQSCTYSWRDPLGWFGAVQLVDSLTHFVDSLTHFVVSWPTLLIRFPTLLMWINTTWKVGIRKWTSTRMLIRVLFRINILVNA